MDVSFTVRVQAIGRLAIPKEIREVLGIRKGDMVMVRVEKVLPRRQKT